MEQLDYDQAVFLGNFITDYWIRESPELKNISSENYLQYLIRIELKHKSVPWKM